jgi:hypothetical protein
MNDPMNQHHSGSRTACRDRIPKVAGTDPRTPRIEIAYETVDHFVNSRRSSCAGGQLTAIRNLEMNDRTCLYPIRASSRSSSSSIVAIGLRSPASTSLGDLCSVETSGGFSAVEAIEPARGMHHDASPARHQRDSKIGQAQSESRQGQRAVNGKAE